jgi:hypothetical protein
VSFVVVIYKTKSAIVATFWENGIIKNLSKETTDKQG